MAKKKTASRRGNNEGSIYQRPSGTWTAQVTLGLDENGQRIRKSYYGNTRAEVAVKMTTAINSKLKGTIASVINDPLSALMTEWLWTFKRATVSPRTFAQTVYKAEAYIYPKIGDFSLNEITSPILQRLLNNMQMDGYALDTVKKTKFLLRQFFEYAVDSEFVSKNPVNKVKLLSRERKIVKEEEYKAVPIEARENFLKALDKSEILKPICMTSMFGGLRIGEILALKWKDIDLKSRSITVNHAITVIPEFDKAGKVVSRKTVISDTKTAASVREVPLPDILLTALEEWKKVRWVHEKKAGKSFIAENDLVFSNNDGELRNYYGIKCMFDKLMKKTGMDKYKLHFHSLRHTYSSMLFEAGENPKVIQMLLGHKEVTTTIKTYNSVDRSYFRQATDKLDMKFYKNQ